MAAVPDGQWSFDRFRQHDAEQSPGGVGLGLASTGAKAVEVDRASRGSTDVNGLQFSNLDVGRIPPLAAAASGGPSPG